MDEFDTDYSFLNLPEAGSDVRGPIGLPSIAPVSFDLFGGRRPIRRPRPEPIEIEPIRRIERGDDQGRFEMGRAIGQEVNMLRENIQTLEAAKGELVSERDAAIQMQDQIRQQMSEQRIQELDQQQAQLQAELQEAVAAAEARGIDALAEAEAQAAEELASVSADFQSQIDALTGERDQAIAEQDMIRAEAAEQQVQALEAQKQNYESQLAEMTGQTTQRDQTIAELQAQIEGLQQAPAETPAVPDIGPIPGMEDFKYLDLLSKEQPQEVKDMVAKSMATGEPVISPDQVQEMINRMPVRGPIPPRDIIPPRPPQLPPKRKDQIFISDQPRFISEERSPLQQAFDKIQGSIKPAPTAPVNTGPITIMGQTLSQEDSDKVRAGSGFLGGGPLSALPRTTTTPPPQMRGPFIKRQIAPIPPAPAITPPRRPMSVGGIGGMGGRINRMMVR